MSEHQVIEAVTSDAAFIRPSTGQSYQECHEQQDWFCDYPEMWFWTGVFTRVADVVVKVSFFYTADDRLYRVLLAADVDRSAAFFDTVIRDEARLLASIIARSRGEPYWTRRLSILDMEAGYIKYSEMWSADPSGVVHAVGIGEKLSTFYAALHVTWEPLAEAVRRREGGAREQRIEEAAGDF